MKRKKRSSKDGDGWPFCMRGSALLEAGGAMATKSVKEVCQRWCFDFLTLGTWMGEHIFGGSRGVCRRVSGRYEARKIDEEHTILHAMTPRTVIAVVICLDLVFRGEVPPTARSSRYSDGT